MSTLELARFAAGLALVGALTFAVTGCTLSTGNASGTNTTSTESPDAGSGQDDAAGGPSDPDAPVPDGLTLEDIVSAFEEADVVPGGTRSPLAVDGFASDGIGLFDSASAGVEIYWVDPNTASDDVKANFELAKSEGRVDYGDGYSIMIASVRGQFMLNSAFASDPDAALAVWKEVTTAE